MQPSVLRRRAGALLQNAVYNPKKLVLIHAAITIGGYLLVDILYVLLSWKISQTGGLSGIELRSMLTTAQQLLDALLMMALPFWNIGLLFAGLRWARAESPMPNDLLDGFRRFGPIFRLRLFQAALIFCISIGISNISYIIFLLTPFADSFIDQMNGLMEQSGASGLITEEQTLSLMQDALPLMIIFGVILAIVLIFLFTACGLLTFSSWKNAAH